VAKAAAKSAHAAAEAAAAGVEGNALATAAAVAAAAAAAEEAAGTLDCIMKTPKHTEMLHACSWLTLMSNRMCVVCVCVRVCKAAVFGAFAAAHALAVDTAHAEAHAAAAAAAQRSAVKLGSTAARGASSLLSPVSSAAAPSLAEAVLEAEAGPGAHGGHSGAGVHPSGDARGGGGGGGPALVCPAGLGLSGVSGLLETVLGVVLLGQVAAHSRSRLIARLLKAAPQRMASPLRAFRWGRGLEFSWLAARVFFILSFFTKSVHVCVPDRWC